MERYEGKKIEKKKQIILTGDEGARDMRGKRLKKNK
jgi:hypothetical protein